MQVPDDLLKAAKEALPRAYAPYSGYRVAAAVRGGSGRIYAGVNVENASYGLSMCAERVATFNAIANGERSITEVLVLVERGPPAIPCGACLQVLSEFGSDDLKVYSVSLASGETREWTLRQLMPWRFTKNILDRAREGPGAQK